MRVLCVCWKWEDFALRLVRACNCVLFLCGLSLIWVGDAWTEDRNKPNIVLIVIDTLGAKYLGSKSGEASSTPQIDLLVKEGVAFDHAYSTAPWTKPAVGSIFSGLLPLEHGAMHLRSVFEPKTQVMAELLGEAGYSRAGVVSHTLIGPKTGYKRGFESYQIVEFNGNIHNAVTSNQVTALGIEWLKKRQEKPFFLFLHYFDPHFNYQHHPDFDLSSNYKGEITPGMGFREVRDRISTFDAEDQEYLRNLYREEVRYTDHHIGVFLQNLKSLGLSENTVVILTADHGEEFFEHGWIGHTRTLFDELIHVPLIISYPGKFKTKKILENVSNVDLLPTICELANISSEPPGLAGRSLVPWLLDTGALKAKRSIISEVNFKSSAIEAHKISAVIGKHKGIFDFLADSWSFYDLASDPEERNPLVLNDQSALQELKQVIQKRIVQHKDGNISEKILDAQVPEELVPPKEIESLKSLGYM